MQSVTLKHMLPELSEELGISEEDIKNYWYFIADELNREIASLNHYEIRFKGLGTWRLTIRDINNKLKILKERLSDPDSLSEKDFKRYSREIQLIQQHSETNKKRYILKKIPKELWT